MRPRPLRDRGQLVVAGVRDIILQWYSLLLSGGKQPPTQPGK